MTSVSTERMPKPAVGERGEETAREDFLELATTQNSSNKNLTFHVLIFKKR